MSVFHHVIKSLGTRYDPLAGKVVAHVVGGGSVDNTTFRDISPNNTPAVTVGSLKGAAASGPFGNVVSLKPGTGSAGLTLSASDNRFRLDGPMGSQFTVDGWLKLPPTPAGLSVPTFWELHTTSSGELTVRLEAYGNASANNLRLVVSDGSNEWQICNVPAVEALNGQWVYVYAVINQTPGTHQLRVGDRAPVTGTRAIVVRTVAQSFSIGARSNGYTDNFNTYPTEFYTFRVTKGIRPYDAALRTSLWPEAGGTQNWLGAPVGSSAPVGQKVLAHSEVWVVPPGITSFSAVAVGCKLSISGTDVLAATWPVLGDGGGQGGAGGTGHSETVVSWSNGEPRTGFGGGGGTVRSEQTYTYYGGGGGAGGYTGNGGHGVNTQGATASAGQGGGGGGGATQAWGGGVGLKGQGASGAGGSNPGQPGSANGTTYGGGKPGSGGGVNGTAGNNLAWRNNIPVTQGQVVLCTYIGQSGQTGAARLMWGDARSYPNNAGDVE